MFTALLFAITVLGPVLMVTIAIFLAVSAVTWVALGRVSGDDQPRAESRLDLLKDPRRSRTVEVEDGKSKKDKKKQAVTAILERATSPMEKAVKGTEKEMSELREQLMNAGFRREGAPIVFKGLQLIFTGFGLFVGGVYGLIFDGLTQALVMKVGIGVVAGFAIPKLLLSHMAKKRKMKIFLGLPDALDLMVVCVEAGLGMDQALRKVADEMKKSHPTIGEEFGIANQQLQLGRPRAEVLQALGYRSGVDDLKQLASILIQADKFGSSVATALRVQSDSMRCKRRQMAEEKAAKTAVKMIFPLVLFIFPGIFVVLVGPAAINMYRNLLTI